MGVKIIITVLNDCLRTKEVKNELKNVSLESQTTIWDTKRQVVYNRDLNQDKLH